MKMTLRATALFALSLAFGGAAPAHAEVFYDNQSTYAAVPAVMPVAYYGNGYYENAYNGYYGNDYVAPVAYYGNGYAAPVTTPVAYYGDPYAVDTWHTAALRRVPVRFGDLSVHEQNFGNVWRHVVTFNGSPLLRADNQRGELSISQPFRLNGEDAVIFTAFYGDTACPYHNYLIVVREDGTAPAPRQISSCTNAHEAHITNNTLFVSFPGIDSINGWSAWDTWRYENSALIRM